jgi:hypothetical protein
MWIVFNDVVNWWRRRKNTKIPIIISYIKGQKIKWLGHVKWKEATNKVRVTMDWQPEKKRPKRRPKKRWIDGIYQDLERLWIINLEELVKDLESWRALAENYRKLLQSHEAMML